MRRLGGFLMLMAAVSLLMASMGHSAFQQPAGLSQADLARNAKQAIDGDEVMIAEPVITTHNGTLSWYLGGATCVFGPYRYEESDEPTLHEMLQIPLNAQLQVEVIRKYRRRQPLLTQIASVLGKVEAQIAEQLRVIQNSGLNGGEKMNQLQDIDSKIWEVYAEAMQAEAKRRGLKDAQPVAAAAGPGQVELVTQPAGGEVLLMHVLEARLAKAEGRPARWETITNLSNVDAEGKYWYAIRRDGKTTVGAQPIRLEPNHTYTLR